MRRAFTLIELLAIVAIIGIMVAAGVVSLGAGQGAARTRGATRDIFATIRQARSTALVTMHPCVVTYDTIKVDDEVCAKVEASRSNQMGSKKQASFVETLSGERIDLSEPDSDGDVGETVVDVLFAPISTSVLKGMVLKVVRADDEIVVDGNEAKSRSMISAFSNVDALLGRASESKTSDDEQKKKDAEEAKSYAPSAADENQEEVKIRWEVNGQCEPHRVYVYPSGKTPEHGLCIKVDKFGAIKVLSFDEEDE